VEENTAGAIEMVRVGDVRRPSYQDDRFRPSDVDRIVRDFNPALVGVPDVNRRADGTISGVDGNHRIAAHVEKFGPEYEIPMMVHQGLTVDEEVALFLDRSSRTRKVSAYERFMVRYRSGAATEKAIMAIVQEHGFDVGNSGGTRTNQINATSVLESIFGAMDRERYGRMPGASPELLDRTLRIAAAIWPDHSGRLGQFLAGLAVLLANRGAEIKDRELIRKVQAYGTVYVIIGRSKGYSSHGSAIEVANVLLEIYNYKRTTHRVDLIELATKAAKMGQ
jgi:hypothetical protein